MKKTALAKNLLNGVWEGDYEFVKETLMQGADPSWVFNGYPILIHAIYLQEVAIAQILISYGAIQLEEALGFALEHGYGQIIISLAYLGVIPKECKKSYIFGEFPARYAPTSISVSH